MYSIFIKLFSSIGSDFYSFYFNCNDPYFPPPTILKFILYLAILRNSQIWREKAELAALITRISCTNTSVWTTLYPCTSVPSNATRLISFCILLGMEFKSEKRRSSWKYAVKGVIWSVKNGFFAARPTLRPRGVFQTIFDLKTWKKLGKVAKASEQPFPGRAVQFDYFAACMKK